MARFRSELPQLREVFLTDGGIETTLIFHDGLDLPLFASFHLLRTAEGTAALTRYFDTYAQLASADGVGMVLEAPTWRASPDWGDRLGYSTAELADANRRAVELIADLATHTTEVPIVVSGCIGPRGDGYDPGEVMSVAEARDYHSFQVEQFAATDADMVGAITMTTPEEAAGLALAARDGDLPVAVSFTVETDGALPTGQPLAEAIAFVDEATGAYPAYYMLNCAHPVHFGHVLDGNPVWARRLRGLRANASTLSHAELDEATELDDGDPEDLARRLVALRDALPQLTVLGGCCGTDHRHIAAISRACARR